MTNIQTVTEHFYLQWHGEGQTQGAWRASDGDADRQFLDRWTLAAPETQYTFEFGVQQGNGQPYTVFAQLTNDPGGPVYGVRIEPNRPSTETVLSLSIPGDELQFMAGELISDDPKVVNVPTKPTSSLALIWSVNAEGAYSWTYALDGREPVPYEDGQPIEIGPDSTGAVSITVTDESPEAAQHTCAVYYGTGPRTGSGTNVGIVGVSELVGSDGRLTLEFVPDQPEFTINLFAALSSKKATSLTRVGRGG
jgi:hypothetical protein